ncbi:AraC family transcriptional regulator [Lacrimispora sp.]|uniref:helix-turn-helix transcriptional regulator n=1 Tax=Lacrimispora sp. TaxID=2719234 RepID=UPI00346020BD
MLDQAGIMMAQGSMIASERIYGVNDNMSQSHYHDYFELYYLEVGERYHVVRDQVYCMHQGEFMLFPPYVMHHSYGKDNIPFKRLLLYFRKEEVASERLLDALRSFGGILCLGEKAGMQIHRFMEQLLKEQEQASIFHEEMMSTILNMLSLTLVQLIQQEQTVAVPEEQSWMGNVINYIHNHYAEDLKLENLAQIFYISPYYLCREFKRHTNRTITQYINITRIMNAQRMFMETDKNVTEISRSTGFSNITHFNRVFKNVTGMTPSGYRKSNRIADHTNIGKSL